MPPRARAEAELASVDANTGLIAYWSMNEGHGSSAADTVGGYTATLAASGATWTNGRLGAGVELDGVQGYIASPIIDVPGSALTLAAWVTVADYSTGADQRFISKSTGTAEEAHYWMLSHVQSGGRNLLRFRLKTGSTTTTLIASSGDLPTGTWFHAAATYDGATMRLYLNGTEVGRATKAGPIATSALVPADIGRNPDGSNHLRGVIDEVRIYGRAMSGDELAAVMEDPGVPALDTVAPSTPGNLQASALSSLDVAVQWTASTDDRRVAGYRLKRNGVNVATTASTAYTDTGLTPSTTYLYTVSAFDEAGNDSAESASVSATTLAPDTASAGPAPVVHWKFDEGTGTTATDVAGGLTATLASGAEWAPGRSGYAVHLNGSTACVAAPSIDIAASGMTLAAWVNPFSTGEYQRIISKATGTAADAHYWMLSETPISGARRLRFRLKTGSTTTTLIAAAGDLPIDNWYHAAATYDGATMRLYLDGVEVGRTSKIGTIATNATVPVNIGRSPDGSYPLNGLVDDVRIYDRALSPAEIAAVMADSGPSTNQPPVVELTSPAAGATFTAPATMTLAASASDPENRLSEARFFSDATLLGVDSSVPYSFTWSSVPAGSYSLAAVARDADGAWTTSTAVGVTVTSVASTPWIVAFTASADHDSIVTSYLVEVFASGADPNTAIALATSDLGKPAPDADGEILVDRTSFFERLAAGDYVMTVSAVAAEGSTRSSPYTFSR